VTYSDIEDVKADTTHVFFGADTLLGCPLEASNARVPDFVHILHTFGGIDQQIGSSRIRAETPDLTGLSDIPSEVVSESTGTNFDIVTSSDLAGLDAASELFV
jgi:hypothetical protein